MSYRTPGEAPARTRDHLDRAAVHAKRITDVYWSILEDEQPGLRGEGERIGAALRAGAPVDVLEGEARTLDERLAAAVRDAPRMRRAMIGVPPDLPSEALPRRWPAADGVTFAGAEYRDHEPVQSLWSRVARALSDLDPGVAIEHCAGSFRAIAMRVGDVPLAVDIGATFLSEDVAMTVATAVPRALAPVRVQRFTWVHSVTTAARLQRDTRVGDETFDQQFLVEGSPSSVRRSLEPAVREALLDLTQFAPPRLTIGEGVASLALRYVFSPMLLEEAVAVLRALRHQPVDITLLR